MLGVVGFVARWEVSDIIGGTAPRGTGLLSMRQDVVLGSYPCGWGGIVARREVSLIGVRGLDEWAGVAHVGWL